MVGQLVSGVGDGREIGVSAVLFSDVWGMISASALGVTGISVGCASSVRTRLKLIWMLVGLIWVGCKSG